MTHPTSAASLWLAVLLVCGTAAAAPLASAKEKSTPPKNSAAVLAAPVVKEEAPEAQPLPLRQWKGSFQYLGMGNPLTLRGLESEGSIGVSVRRDELVEAAHLRLTFTLSPALLPGLSHLKVMLNDELVQTVVLNKEQLGAPQTVELEIDPRYFTDYNKFRFQFIGHYTMECENPNHSSLWASVSNDSTLSLSLRQLPQRDDLALLPGPFFDPRDNRAVRLAFVYPAQPSMAMLKASGSVASWMGMLAGYRGNDFTAFENTLPERHAVVFATNEQRPAFLRDLPPVKQPTLAIQAHPSARRQAAAGAGQRRRPAATGG